MLKTLQYGALIGVLTTVIGCTSMVDATTDKPVQFDPGKRTLGSLIDDQQLEIAAAVNIRKADEILDRAHINVVAFNGILLLTGQVPRNDLRTLAGNTAKKVHGVRQVFNEIQVQGKTSFLARANDSWLTTKVKSTLLGHKDIDSGRIKVVSEDGVVYLMGLLSQTEGAKAANVVSNIGGVQKVVKAFEYID